MEDLRLHGDPIRSREKSENQVKEKSTQGSKGTKIYGRYIMTESLISGSGLSRNLEVEHIDQRKNCRGEPADCPES